MITTSVQAKISSVINSCLAFCSAKPIDFSGGYNISAAIPAFQPNPIEDQIDAVKYGITEGKYSTSNRLNALNL